MRQRHTVANAHSVHTVSATLMPVFRLPPSKMDHRRRALLCRFVACCAKKRKKSRKVLPKVGTTTYAWDLFPNI